MEPKNLKLGIVPELQGTPEDIAAEKCKIAADMVGTIKHQI